MHPRHLANKLQASVGSCSETADTVPDDYFFSKTNQVHQRIKFILFWNDTVHVSDGLSVHHQEFKTVYTATGVCKTDTAVCLLAGTR